MDGRGAGDRGVAKRAGGKARRRIRGKGPPQQAGRKMTTGQPKSPHRPLAQATPRHAERCGCHPSGGKATAERAVDGWTVRRLAPRTRFLRRFAATSEQRMMPTYAIPSRSGSAARFSPARKPSTCLSIASRLAVRSGVRGDRCGLAGCGAAYGAGGSVRGASWASRNLLGFRLSHGTESPIQRWRSAAREQYETRAPGGRCLAPGDPGPYTGSGQPPDWLPRSP